MIFTAVMGAAYLSTAIPLFQKAGAQVNSAGELLEQGIYLTNAVKMAKTAPAIERSSIEKSLPYLDWELSLFPHVKVIMLMGDVAKKAFNMISKKVTGKNVIPTVATYKIRKSEIWYQDYAFLHYDRAKYFNLKVEGRNGGGRYLCHVFHN